MGFNYEAQATYVGMRPDSICAALDPPLSFGAPELVTVEKRSHYAYVERRQDLEPPRQGAAKFGRSNAKPRKDTPAVVLDPPSRIGRLRKNSFSPALDPPSRFPAAGAHALDSLSNFPAAGAQFPSHLTDYDTEANYSAHRTEPLCIPSSPPITPHSTYPPAVYAGPFGPYPNHVPPSSSMNRDQPAEVRYRQDKDEGCGCVIL